jgi:uncharacterized protein (DUF302 family)
VEEEVGLDVETSMSFDEAVARTRLVMRTRGFSILSEMPGVKPPGTSEVSHLFMGLWSRVISAGNLGGQGLDVGDHLPCNVVVYTHHGRTHVAVLDPGSGLEGWSEGNLAGEAQAAMYELLEEVSGSPGQ